MTLLRIIQQQLLLLLKGHVSFLQYHQYQNIKKLKKQNQYNQYIQIYQFFKQNLTNHQQKSREERYQGYIIEQQLGKGKYSVVYLARQYLLIHIFKTYLNQFSSCIKGSLEKIINRRVDGNLACLGNQNPIFTKASKYHRFKLFSQNISLDTEIVLVLEYCPGGNLNSYLRKQENSSLCENQASNIIRQIAQALDFLHKHQVLHRDLKPENILLSYGSAKLADFSYCIYSPEIYRRTQCGTLLYTSPEIISKDLYDSKSDLWALGILAYELTFGMTPWDDFEGDQLREKIKHAEIILPNSASSQLKNFIESLTKRIPRERMTTKQALLHPWLKQEREISKNFVLNLFIS